MWYAQVKFKDLFPHSQKRPVVYIIGHFVRSFLWLAVDPAK